MIDLRFGFLFPWPFRLVALICLIASLGIIQASLLGSLILFFASGFVLSAAEGTDINMASKTFREYSSYWFIKTGKFTRFHPIEKIYITKGTEAQVMHTAYANHSATFENIVHNGYLKFSTGEKIHLLREKKKEHLIQKLSPLGKGLNVEIVDHS